MHDFGKQVATMKISDSPLLLVACFLALCQPSLVHAFSTPKPTQLPFHPLLTKQGTNNYSFGPRRFLTIRSSNSQEQDNNNQQSRWHPERVLASILQSFLKGLTLPFPALRDILIRQDDNQSGLAIGLRIRECMAFIACYMGVGVLAYSYVFEKWPLIDSLYFTAVVFSTVG